MKNNYDNGCPAGDAQKHDATITKKPSLKLVPSRENMEDADQEAGESEQCEQDEIDESEQDVAAAEELCSDVAGEDPVEDADVDWLLWKESDSLDICSRSEKLALKPRDRGSLLLF